MVSVVIPCHNAGRWVGETLRSVLSDQDDALEVIVVDDGSDDDTVAIVEQAGSGAVHLIRQTRAGVSRARNVGTAAARGSFIQYLDADDVLVSGTLKARLSALSSGVVDVAYCDWVRLERRPDGAFREGDPERRRLSDRPALEILEGAWWPPGAVLYRRSLVDRILPWREDLPIIQDARFLLDAALAGGTFAHVPAVGLKYRVLDGASLSRRHPRAFLDDCYRNAIDLHDTWMREGTLDPDRRRTLVVVLTQVARAFFPIDRTRFSEVVGDIRRIDPAFVPESPTSLRLVSRLVGYPAAEHVASAWRRIKARARA